MPDRNECKCETDHADHNHAPEGHTQEKHAHEGHAHEAHGHEAHGHEGCGHEAHGHDGCGHEHHTHDGHGHDEHGHEGHGAQAGAPAVAGFEREIAAERARIAAGAADPGGLASLLHRQGSAHLHAGAPYRARVCWQDARAACGEAADPAQRAAISADLGLLLLTLGDSSAAAVLDEAIVMLRAQASAAGPGAGSHGDANGDVGARGGELAAVLAARAGAARHEGDLAGAIASLSEAALLLEARLDATRSTRDAVALAHVLLDLGRAQMAAGQTEAARGRFADGVDLGESLAAADHSQGARNLLNAALNHLGRAEEALGRPELAVPLFERSATDMQRLVDEGRVDLADDLAQAKADLARARAALVAH